MPRKEVPIKFLREDEHEEGFWVEIESCELIVRYSEIEHVEFLHLGNRKELVQKIADALDDASIPRNNRAAVKVAAKNALKTLRIKI
jgi:hypothetical protein